MSSEFLSFMLLVSNWSEGINGLALKNWAGCCLQTPTSCDLGLLFSKAVYAFLLSVEFGVVNLRYER